MVDGDFAQNSDKKTKLTWREVCLQPGRERPSTRRLYGLCQFDKDRRLRPPWINSYNLSGRLRLPPRYPLSYPNIFVVHVLSIPRSSVALHKKVFFSSLATSLAAKVAPFG